MHNLLTSKNARYYGLALVFLFCGTLALSGLLGFFDPFKTHHLVLSSTDNRNEIIIWSLRKVSWFLFMAVSFSGSLLFLDAAVTPATAASDD
ncbi:hypothetical protein ACFQDN_15675 [Pseudomonas asuensis]|jgi:hypothetical protein|uniref:Uncharacterized protein n=1 Tax=Pseudomonas asuensis TaxID=1825787 RepID=A0ABQ2GKB2_9PSED|nr:hypothetical protein [Pseudomonas asuensis]GGM00684.1 hypothetical protein GCM10009425_09800 [Pseudomonas asuensis]